MRPGLHKRTRGTFVLTAVVALVATLSEPRRQQRRPEHSDAVRVWNLHASDALINATGAATPGAGQAPPVSQLHLAMVQGAVYDAVNAIVGGYQPYLPDLPTASPSASQEAAVATAAHHVLVGLENETVRCCRRWSVTGLMASMPTRSQASPTAMPRRRGWQQGQPPQRPCLPHERMTADSRHSRGRKAPKPASGVPLRQVSSTTLRGSGRSNRSRWRAHRSSGRKGRMRSPAEPTQRNTTR